MVSFFQASPAPAVDRLGAKKSLDLPFDIDGSIVGSSLDLANYLPDEVRTHSSQSTGGFQPLHHEQKDMESSQPVASHKRKFLCRRALAAHTPTSRRSRLCTSRLPVPYGNPEHPRILRTAKPREARRSEQSVKTKRGSKGSSRSQSGSLATMSSAHLSVSPVSL